MKKSMLNVITLALVLINLVLTVLLRLLILMRQGMQPMAHRQEVLLILTILNMLRLKAVTAPI